MCSTGRWFPDGEHGSDHNLMCSQPTAEGTQYTLTNLKPHMATSSNWSALVSADAMPSSIWCVNDSCVCGCHLCMIYPLVHVTAPVPPPLHPSTPWGPSDPAAQGRHQGAAVPAPGTAVPAVPHGLPHPGAAAEARRGPAICAGREGVRLDGCGHGSSCEQGMSLLSGPKQRLHCVLQP